MIRSLATPALLVLLTLAGCSHDDGSSPPSVHSIPGPATTSATGPTPASVPATAPPTATTTAAEKPFDQYRAPADEALAWVATYYAMAGTPPDYQAVAARLDPAYQNTTDAFARQDAQTRLKARLDQAIAQAKANPYVRLPPVLMRRLAYDVVQHRYDLTPLIGPQHRLTVANGNARVALAANPGLQAYVPASEAEARALEQALSTNPMQQIDVTIYGKVVPAESMGGDPQITLMPTRVVVANAFVDGSTKPLFTATASP